MGRMIILAPVMVAMLFLISAVYAQDGRMECASGIYLYCYNPDAVPYQFNYTDCIDTAKLNYAYAVNGLYIGYCAVATGKYAQHCQMIKNFCLGDSGGYEYGLCQSGLEAMGTEMAKLGESPCTKDCGCNCDNQATEALRQACIAYDLPFCTSMCTQTYDKCTEDNARYYEALFDNYEWCDARKRAPTSDCTITSCPAGYTLENCECFPKCATDADCPDGKICAPDGSKCVDRWTCTETADCLVAGYACVGGFCVKEQEDNQTDDGGVSTKNDGESCNANFECDSNSCLNKICVASVTPVTNTIFDRTIFIGGRQVHITITADAIYINGRRYERSAEWINEVAVSGLPEGEPLGGLGITFGGNLALYRDGITAIVLNQSLFNYSPCVSDGIECIASGECCSDNCDGGICKAASCNVNSDCVVNRSCALPLCAMHSCTYLMNGCDFFGSCRANGERETINGTPSYCSSDKWHPQLKNGEACQHDSECLDYLCDNGKCGQSSPFGFFTGIIDEILNAIKGLFGMR